MTSAMAAFGIAVGCTSLVCYVLMTRSPNSRRNRRPSGDNSSDSGNYGSGDNWSPAWFGGHHFSSDSSGNPIDSGGGDSGAGGGDGGGGDGGGGGGD